MRRAIAMFVFGALAAAVVHTVDQTGSGRAPRASERAPAATPTTGERAARSRGGVTDQARGGGAPRASEGAPAATPTAGERAARSRGGVTDQARGGGAPRASKRGEDAMSDRRSRRDFLKTVAAGTAMAPTILRAQAPSAAQNVSPNDRIRIAAIGAGIRGLQDVRSALKMPGVELVAVADVYEGRL